MDVPSNVVAGVDINSSAARQLRLTTQQVQAALAEKAAQFRASQAAERAEETAKAERAEMGGCEGSTATRLRRCASAARCPKERSAVAQHRPCRIGLRPLSRWATTPAALFLCLAVGG
jgi:hypothetical protein